MREGNAVRDLVGGNVCLEQYGALIGVFQRLDNSYVECSNGWKIAIKIKRSLVVGAGGAGLRAAIEADPYVETTVDLPSQTITRGDIVVNFQIDDYTKHRLLNGLDDISMTLQHADAIAAYEATRPSFKPKTLPARTAG